MNKMFFFFLLGLMAIMPLAAEKHPQAAALQRFIDQNPIESRIPEMMIYISQKSEELNAAGYDLYLKKRYPEAIAQFEQAVQADADNSFAWYNMACCYALTNEGYKASQCLEEAVGRDWFWGLQLMVDPDLDGVRYTGISYEYAEYDPWDKPVFTHHLYENGTVDFYDDQFYQSGTPRKLGSGYFCIISYGAVFEFFPFLDSYMVDGPNGPIGIPAANNVVKLPNIALR